MLCASSGVWCQHWLITVQFPMERGKRCQLRGETRLLGCLLCFHTSLCMLVGLQPSQLGSGRGRRQQKGVRAAGSPPSSVPVPIRVGKQLGGISAVSWVSAAGTPARVKAALLPALPPRSDELRPCPFLQPLSCGFLGPSPSSRAAASVSPRHEEPGAAGGNRAPPPPLPLFPRTNLEEIIGKERCEPLPCAGEENIKGPGSPLHSQLLGW